MLGIFILLTLKVNAQQTIATTGGDANGSGGSASYTIGQQEYIR